MLAGLSGSYIFMIPPCFWAKAASAANTATNNEPAVANLRRFRLFIAYLPWFSQAGRALRDYGPQRNPRSQPAVRAPFAGLSWLPTFDRIPSTRSATSAARGRRARLSGGRGD